MMTSFTCFVATTDHTIWKSSGYATDRMCTSSSIRTERRGSTSHHALTKAPAVDSAQL